MLADVSGEELTELETFTEIEPIGEAREDYRLAYLVAVMVNLQRGKDDKARPPSDFLEDFDFWRVPLTPEEEAAKQRAAILKAMRQLVADQKTVAAENARLAALRGA